MKGLFKWTVTLTILGAVVVAFFWKGDVSVETLIKATVRAQDRTLCEVKEQIKVYETNVNNARAGYNTVMNLVDSTSERKDEVAANVADCQEKLEFFKTRIENGEGVYYEDGSQLTEQDLEVEVERYRLQLDVAKEAERDLTDEISQLKNAAKIYSDWALVGPIRLDALKQKYANTRRLFETQIERMRLLDDYKVTDVKDEYKKIMSAISAERDKFGLGKGGTKAKVVDFSKHTPEDVASKTTSLIQKINASLSGLDAPNEDRQISFNNK